MIAISDGSSIYFVKLGGQLKTAAETKEQEKTLEGTEIRSVLKLVPRSGQPSSDRAFRIDVADDVFERREKRRERALQPTRRRVENGSDDNPADENRENKVAAQVEPVFVLAAAAFVIGFIFGRHSRD